MCTGRQSGDVSSSLLTGIIFSLFNQLSYFRICTFSHGWNYVLHLRPISAGVVRVFIHYVCLRR